MQSIETLYIVLGILTIILALPLITRKIKPNWLYGFRTPTTLANADLWYDINAYFGRWLLGVGVVFLIASIVLAQVPGISVDAYAIGATVIIVGGLALGIALSFQRISRYRK